MTARIVSKRGRKATKPAKPRADFPLFSHACGQWAKKVRGKLHYFGPWDDPQSAESRWDRDKHALLRGDDPSNIPTDDTIEGLCNSFCESKELQRERGELSKRAFDDYHRIAKHVAAHFGKGRKLDTLRSVDFEKYRNTLSATWSPSTINNHLRLVRVLFKYANDTGATRYPIRYAIGLKQVPRSIVRKHEAKQPSKEFSAEEVHLLLAKGSLSMRAFILLGLNCGYGTMDIARSKLSDFDFEQNWIGEPRGKTGIARGAWLWPETVQAVQAAIEKRFEPHNAEWDDLAFLTRNRRPWAIDGSTSHPLTQSFHRLKLDAGIKRKGVGHYSLRHTFATVAGDAKDQPAVDYIMGHCDPSMSAVYREGVDPERVKAVCNHVRSWWLAGKGGAK